MRFRLVTLAAAVLLATALVDTVALDAQTRGADARRIVAVGDVHGSVDGFTAILRTAGLLDDARRWIGGDATLVQTGDLTDRGADVRQVLDLVMALEREAPKAGGRVVALLGNHEVMNLVGDLRDTTPAICATFADGRSEALRERSWREYEQLVARRARARPQETPAAYTRTREAWLAAYPPGCIEYRLALGPRGVYGKWLRERAIAAEVDGSVFMHAGPPPDTTATPAELNAAADGEIGRFDRFVQRLVDARLARPWFRFEDLLAVAAAEVRWTTALLAAAKEKGETPNLAGIDVDLVKDAVEVLRIAEWSLLAGQGPLWYRGYALADDATLQAPFEGLLARWRARRLVVGHTVNRDGRIRARFGRLFLIDTGMLTAVYKGAPSALEIAGERVTALYTDGTRTPLAVPTP